MTNGNSKKITKHEDTLYTRKQNSLCSHVIENLITFAYSLCYGKHTRIDTIFICMYKRNEMN